jgi:hypothetical protein
VSEPSPRDKWAEWVFSRSHGDDAEQKRRWLEYLGPIRDRLLENSGITPGKTLLDVGTGDGLIAFGRRRWSASRVACSSATSLRICSINPEPRLGCGVWQTRRCREVNAWTRLTSDVRPHRDQVSIVAPGIVGACEIAMTLVAYQQPQMV